MESLYLIVSFKSYPPSPYYYHHPSPTTETQPPRTNGTLNISVLPIIHSSRPIIHIMREYGDGIMLPIKWSWWYGTCASRLWNIMTYFGILDVSRYGCDRCIEFCCHLVVTRCLILTFAFSTVFPSSSLLLLASASRRTLDAKTWNEASTAMDNLYSATPPVGVSQDNECLYRFTCN